MKKKIISTKRVLKSGFVSFLRNKTVSLSSIGILTTTLIIIGVFFFFRGIFDYSLNQVRNKVDIKIYFKLDAEDSQILDIKNKIKTLPEVQSIELVTAEQSLTDFQEKHSNDPVTLQALAELDTNPFGAMLTVFAKDTNSYDYISNTLSSESDFLGESYSAIDKINYFELKPTIDRLNNMIRLFNSIGYWITLLFLVISSLIIFNTIRLSIFIYKEEIAVMKLVGASNMHIRGPFLVESSIYAVISSLLAMIFFFPTTFYLAKNTIDFFSGLDIFQYYLQNFFVLFLLLLIISLLLATFSSLLAIRRYLKI
ncbi:MAG TPA: permease-like cell division protein FtsX [Candidatus Paceibacterota bacterium]|nr:permease-like cell division protein FtsX [Candidatus Paceibacterota bacterium]HPX52274.1 permease-like cell division protein FtsX [Candidatus Paceibacterota bacterium]HQB56987.1 permease-like cell division protein FtsX [Candidatus Paceibacterota bacterium]